MFWTFPMLCYLPWNNLYSTSCQKVHTYNTHTKKNIFSTSSHFLPISTFALTSEGGTFDQVKRKWETDELKGACVQLLLTVLTLKCQRCGTLMDVAAARFPGPIWARVSPQCDHSMKRLMLLMVQEVTQRGMWSPPVLDSLLGCATMEQDYLYIFFDA